MSARKSAASESLPTYTLNVTTDSTQVPDWLLLCNKISRSARVLAGVILSHQKRGEAPTIPMLAADLDVDSRTVSTWLSELITARVIDPKRNGRGRFYSFLTPRRRRNHDPTINDLATNDRGTVDRGTVDRGTVDRGIMGYQPQSEASGRSKPVKRARTSAPNSHGGGGDHDSHEDSDPPTPPPARPARRIKPEDITGATGRWMVKEAFSLAKAYQFQHLPLRPCQLDYERRRQLGQGLGAIALAWEVEAPSSPPIAQASESTDGPEAPHIPPPAGRTIEESQARWEMKMRERIKP